MFQNNNTKSITHGKEKKKKKLDSLLSLNHFVLQLGVYIFLKIINQYKKNIL